MKNINKKNVGILGVIFILVFGVTGYFAINQGTGTETKIVGGENFGYVTVPSNYEKYVDELATVKDDLGVQYTDGKNRNIITLSYAPYEIIQDTENVEKSLDEIVSVASEQTKLAKVIDKKTGVEYSIENVTYEKISAQGFSYIYKINSEYDSGKTKSVSYIAIPENQKVIILFTAEGTQAFIDDNTKVFLNTWKYEKN